MSETTTPHPDACRNCRRPIHWLDGIGWLHGELPQYAGEPITCGRPEPVCSPRPFTTATPGCEGYHLAAGPDPACQCSCHLPSAERTRR